MKSIHDRIYSYGFGAMTIILTSLLFLSNSYTVYPTNAPVRTIIGHMLLDNAALFSATVFSYF